MIRDERKKSDQSNLNITREGRTSRQLWNYIKKQAGWANSSAPSLLSIEGKPITNTLQIAKTLNECFIQKVNLFLKIYQNSIYHLPIILKPYGIDGFSLTLYQCLGFKKSPQNE